MLFLVWHEKDRKFLSSSTNLDQLYVLVTSALPTTCHNIIDKVLVMAKKLNKLYIFVTNLNAWFCCGIVCHYIVQISSS